MTLLTNFWIALITSVLLVKPIMWWLNRVKSRQNVSVHAPEGHQVKQGTPTMGGIIIVKAVTIAMLIAWFRDPGSGRMNLTGLILMVGFGLIGFVDDFVVPRIWKDKRGLGWKQKFGMQVVIAILAVLTFTGGRIDSVAAFYTFTILFFSNAYNFSDGLDGLAGSLLVILGAGIVALDLLSGTDLISVYWVVPMIGASIPFLFLNAPPARVFMGDVGSLPIGAVLGASVAVLVAPPAAQTAASPWPVRTELIVPILVVSFMMIAELVPVPLQILSVKLRRKKLFPFTPIHHAFERAGWKETRVVWTFALWQLLLTVAAVTIYMCGKSQL